MHDEDVKPRRIMIIGSGMAGSLSGHYKTAMINQLIALLAEANIQIVDADAMPEVIVNIKDPNDTAKYWQASMEKIITVNNLSMLAPVDLDLMENWYKSFPVQRHYLPRSVVYQKPKKIRNPKQRVIKWIKK